MPTYLNMGADLVEKIEEEKERRREHLIRLERGDVIKTSRSDYFLVSAVKGNEIYGKQVKPVSINQISINFLLKRKEVYISKWKKI